MMNDGISRRSSRSSLGHLSNFSRTNVFAMVIQISRERCRRAATEKRQKKLTMMRRSTRLRSSASSPRQAPTASPSGSSSSTSSSDEESERLETSPRRNRQRSPCRTNIASLPNHLQKALLQDIENAGGIKNTLSTLKGICDYKEDVYGPPKSALRKKVQERVRYWRSLPENEYYHLVATLGVRLEGTPQSVPEESSSPSAQSSPESCATSTQSFSPETLFSASSSSSRVQAPERSADTMARNGLHREDSKFQ